MNARERLLERKLPKWPQMVVTGTPISDDQALEIIRRTDIFFNRPIGNNKHFVREALRAVEYPAPVQAREGCAQAEKDFIEELQRWRKRWGVIDLMFVENDWLSSVYVAGPHGWCHPNGMIGYIDNVGAYPTARFILDDWTEIARHFPFLELEITLMDGEACDDERKPVISYLVRGGTVEAIDPYERNLHEEFNRTILKPFTDEEWERRIEGFTRASSNDESALPIGQFYKWATALKNKESET